MTAAERATLQASLDEARAFWPRALPTLALLAAAGSGLIYLAWRVMAWIAGTVSDMAWTARFEPWVLPVGILASLAWSAAIFAKAWRRLRRGRAEVERDLAAGEVEELALVFDATQRLQEPEHGGLIYFLHTTDDRVFVLYDYDSQQRGVDGKDPLRSKFRPTRELLLVRAPASGRTLERRFSGERLPLAAPLPLDLPPEQWPEDETFCDAARESLFPRATS